MHAVDLIDSGTLLALIVGLIIFVGVSYIILRKWDKW